MTRCLPLWRELLSGDVDEDFIIKGISLGFDIVVSDNISKVKPVVCKNYKSVTDPGVKLKVEKQLIYEIKAGRYMFTTQKPLIVSALGAIPKPDSDDLRLIHDCSRPQGNSVNTFADPKSFQFNTIDNACSLIHRGYYMAKIDLKAAYRSVGINPNHYPLTGLQWTFEGDENPSYLVDTRLMFGASQAVEIFHRISNAVVRMAQKRLPQAKIVNYLDDFLIIAPTYQECNLVMESLLDLVQSLGFEVSWPKVVKPTTIITFLGIQINSEQLKLFIPKSKLHEIKGKVRKWLLKRKATKRELQSLAGSIAWAAKCVKAVRPILRNIIDLFKSLRNANHNIRLPAVLKSDVRYLLQWCEIFNGVDFGQTRASRPVTTCYTDASLIAAGAVYGSDFLYADWETDLPCCSNASIFVKEVAAVYLAFKKWAHLWADHLLILNIDNKGTLYALQKGLSSHKLANTFIHNVLWAAALYNIDIQPVYIPSAENVIADGLSRLYEFDYFLSTFCHLVDRGINPYGNSFNLLDHMSIHAFCSLLTRYVARGAGIRCPYPQIS